MKTVIIGGGTGGTVLANKLADKLRSRLRSGDDEILMVTEGEYHVYQPIFLYVAFGRKEVQDGVRRQTELLDDDVRLRVDKVVKIDTDARTVRCTEGEDIDYDRLVVATGSEVAPDEVPGLEENGHGFHTSDDAEKLRDELAELEEGKLVMSVAGMPHKCPAAPVEFPLIADDWLSERGRNVEVTYTYPLESGHAKETVGEWAIAEMEERGIEAKTGFEVNSVEEDVVVSSDGEEVGYDLLVAIPPHDADGLVAESDLGEVWIKADKNTLEAKNAEGIYAVGDVADLPTSKAGSAAHYQATTVANRLASEARGETPTATYDGKTMCFLESGTDMATYMEFVYDEEPIMRPPSKYIHWAKLAYNETYWLTARGML
ncbi:MAG: NAD(P)/FAD-dependent oxidoreductase [Halobacteriales archaeon]